MDDGLNMKTNFGMGFTIQSILEENGNLLKVNPLTQDKEKDDDSWSCLDAQAAFLGPNIWGSTLDTDFKLECVDLEEFLNENELLGGSGLGADSPAPPCRPAPADGPEAALAEASPPPLPPPEQAPLKPAPRGRHSEAEEKPVSRRERSSRVRVPVKFRVSPSDLALATAPGLDFDPQTRQFSDDELKPQPMCKKSKKQVVPDERKDQKYWTRRERNNFAAKRSRDARRLKENQIVLRANFLEKENAALKESMEEITRENERLRARLASCACH
ncbi:hepatic leukemia factor-like [Pollicipes pollicipes]|uniref:hepatic leukemia factor-like n=1 Tax=Pollicipes pollicipes TaxID=41117 RepID=UPI0018851BB2|nr:hepatic leukemia factor-like [Pollicipes pollicipes]